MSFNIKEFYNNSLYYDSGGLVLRRKWMEQKFMNNIDDLIAEYNKFHEEFKLKAQERFKELFKSYWDLNPKVHAVVWHQYTPYFNDGEPCVFSVGDLWPLTKENFDKWEKEGSSSWDAEELSFERDYDARKPDGSKYGWSEVPYKVPDDTWTQEEVIAAMSVKKLNVEAMENIFLTMFGDHVMVIATRDGFEVEDFDHD